MRRLGCALALTSLWVLFLALPAQAAPASCDSTRSPASFRACIATATATYTQLWASMLATHGATVPPPTIRIFTSTPINPCFDATVGDVAEASFWCNKDASVYVSAFAAPYWTRQYAREAKGQGVLASDAKRVGRSQRRLLRGFANQGAATELAHELGHWVQTQMGLDTWYDQRMNSSTPGSERYASAAELSADCMAGWVQGRAAATGAWRNTPFIRWAEQATIAELGGLGDMKPHFTFPPERHVIGHGAASTRLAMYSSGWTMGVAGTDGIAGCARAAGDRTRTDVPPLEIATPAG